MVNTDIFATTRANIEQHSRRDVKVKAKPANDVDLSDYAVRLNSAAVDNIYFYVNGENEVTVSKTHGVLSEAKQKELLQWFCGAGCIFC